MSPVQRGLISMIHLPITTNMELLQGPSLRLQPIRGASILKIVLEILLILTPHIKSVLFRQGPQSLLSLLWNILWFHLFVSISTASILFQSTMTFHWDWENEVLIFSTSSFSFSNAFFIQNSKDSFSLYVSCFMVSLSSLAFSLSLTTALRILFLHVYPQSANSWSIPDFTKCISSPG